MTLIEKLNYEIQTLEEAIFPDENEYQYFKELSKKITENKDLSTFNNSDILEFLLILNRKKGTYDDILETFSLFYENIYEYSDAELIYNLLDYIYTLIQIDAIDIVQTTEGVFDAKELFTKINTEKKENIRLLKEIEPDLDIEAIICNLKILGIHIFRDFDLLKYFIELILNYDGELDVDFCKVFNYKDKYDDIAILKSVGCKKNNIIRLEDGEEVLVGHYLEGANATYILQKISSRYFELKKQRESFDKGVTKKIVLYKSIVCILEDMPESFFEVDENQYNKLNDEFYCEFMQSILKHNRSIFSNLQIQNIKNSRYNDIEILFSKYGIMLSELSNELKNILLKNAKYEQLEKVLICLTSKYFSWLNIKHPSFVQVVLNSNIDILKYIISCLDNELISVKFIQNNIGILIEDNIYQFDNDVEALFNIFKNNLEFLQKNIGNLNRRLLKNENLLLMPCDNLKLVMQLVKTYELDLNSENSKLYSLDILNHPKYFDYLDSFIELGFASYIKSNSQILRKDSKDIVTRLSIISNIGLNPMSKENRLLGSITNGKNFYVSQDELHQYELLKVEDYISNENFEILSQNERLSISNEILQLDVVKYLDELFKISELEYQINENIISRIKFLRNIECLTKNKECDSSVVFVSITYNSVLDDETIDFIKNMIAECKSQDKRISFNKK